jgi:hypothetical protein
MARVAAAPGLPAGDGFWHDPPGGASQAAMGVTMVRQNPTMAAALLAAALAAAPVPAQPFQLASDGSDGVWVLDENSGAVSWCRLVTPQGAKLVDVFGADAQVREAPARPAEPRCEQVRGPSATAAQPVDLVALFDDSYGDDVEYAPWWGQMRERWLDRGDVGGGSYRGDVGVMRLR